MSPPDTPQHRNRPSLPERCPLDAVISAITSVKLALVDPCRGKSPSVPLALASSAAGFVLCLFLLLPSFASNKGMGPDAIVEMSVFERPRVSVVVLVTSRAESRHRRDLMRPQFKRSLARLRARMGAQAAESIVIRFLIGKGAEDAVREEADEFNDFVFLDCKDADHRHKFSKGKSATTMKVMLGIAWAVDSYDFDYLFRVGDDAYLRIDYFRELIEERRFARQRLVLGHVKKKHAFRGVTYTYPSGMGFALTYDICAWIATSSKHGLLYATWPEDAMVGRWLLAVNVEMLHYGVGFHDYRWKKCSNSSILIHKLPDEAWDRIDSEGRLDCSV